MSKSVIVKANGEIETKNLDTLASLQDAVGGHIEAIGLSNKNLGHASGYVNEEGKLIGLPINKVATLLWMVVNGYKELHDVLVGDVIFTGEVDEEGNTRDISDAYVKFIYNFNEFIK